MIESLLNVSPAIPVVVLDDAVHAVELARALVAGGVPIIELTLRTPAALQAIRNIAADVPEILVGAGSVVRAEQAAEAAAAGARFLVSPGSTSSLLDAMADTGLPHLPGMSTVSEALALLERGYTELKFFPAEASGGSAFISALLSPLPTARFCPTGGINADMAASYLRLPNVGCVGGSWLTPPDAVASMDWDRIRRLAAATQQLRATA